MEGCCYGNEVIIVEQTPTSNTTFNLLTPCVSRYLTLQCPQISLSKICTDGINTAVSFAPGVITFNSVPPGSMTYKTPPGLPNVYSPQSVLAFQQVISTAFLQAANPANTPSKELLFLYNIEITNYMYYNGTTELSLANGTSPHDQFDYKEANRATFYFNVVQTYASDTTWQENLQYMNNPAFGGFIASAYGLVPPAVAAKANGTGVYYNANPLDTAHNSGSTVSLSSIAVWMYVLSIIAFAATM